MKRCLLLLCIGLIYAGESYQVTGDVTKADAFIYQQSLVLRHVQNMAITTQPRFSQLSYLSDVSGDGLILTLKPNTSYIVSTINDGYQIYCYDDTQEPNSWHVIIDPGHGGQDPGAMAVSGLQEKEVALKFSQYFSDFHM